MYIFILLIVSTMVLLLILTIVNIALAGLAGNYGFSAPVVREAMRTRPIPQSTEPAVGPLVDALDKYVESQGRKAPEINLTSNVPEDTLKGKYDAFANTEKYASSGNTTDGDYYVKYNPNSSREMFAHELGHIAAKNTDVGNFIANTRNSPALRNALGKAALMTVPAGVFAAAMPGDEDTAQSIALASIIAAPEILDEANASMKALGLMKDAGMRADLGQRGRLAGALLSYAAIPIAMGGSANFVGNLVDDDQQTSGTVQMN